jgi:hypothetical protein
VFQKNYIYKNILAMERINRKQNSMTSKSIIFMYWRASKKRRYDESKDDMFIFFIMMSLLVFITTIFPKCRYYLPDRTLWVDARQETFWEEIVMGEWLTNLELLDERWVKEFRMI